MWSQTGGPGRFSDTYPPERRRLPLNRWPEPDRNAFEYARRPGSAFELPGPAALWAPETCRSRTQSYGRFLNFLARNGILLATESPGERATPDRLTPYITEARELLSALSLDQSLKDLRSMLQAMVPEGDWRWVTRHPDRPSGSEIRASKKAKATFDPRVLCCRALDMMDHLSAGPMTHELRVLYRNALIVVIQCVFTLRRRNLIGMALGRNLVVEDNLIRLIFTKGETKNYTPIDWLVPGFLKPYLLTYLGHHRPALLGDSHSSFVWVSSKHQTLRYGAIPHLFNSIGMHLLGYPIACHCFRHSMATCIMTKDPRKLKLVSGALTHLSLRVANKHYDLSGEAGSRRIWDKVRQDIKRGKGLHQP
jgi:site-specific recombinase XerD